MDVVVAVHAQSAILVAAFRVKNLQVGHLELLANFEQFRGDCWVDDGWLQHSG